MAHQISQKIIYTSDCLEIDFTSSNCSAMYASTPCPLGSLAFAFKGSVCFLFRGDSTVLVGRFDIVHVFGVGQVCGSCLVVEACEVSIALQVVFEAYDPTANTVFIEC